MDYKLSFFNEYIYHDDIKYVWNTKSGALVRLDSDGEDYVSRFTGEEEDNAIFKVLKDNGIVVPSEIDEVGKILYDEECSMFNKHPESVFYTIAPGMDCNMFCVYCFEYGRDRKKIMSEETVRSLISFIEKRTLANRNVKKLRIKWFGGEPLLYMDIIRSISNKVIQLCEEHDINYEAGIITNGSLLTPDICDNLVKLHVKRAQITLDGVETDYCKSKGVKKEVFSKTVENLIYACDKINVTIRINIQNNDSMKAIELTDYLLKEKELLEKIWIYFAFVRNYNKASCIEDYKYYCTEYKKWIIHMISNYQWNKKDVKKGLIKTTSCATIRCGNYCIGPSGELYKCEHCIGNLAESVGSVTQGDYYNKNEQLYMQTIRSSNREECKRCKLLPLCLGGCANDVVGNNPGFDCVEFRKLQVELKKMYSGLYPPQE